MLTYNNKTKRFYVGDTGAYENSGSCIECDQATIVVKGSGKAYRVGCACDGGIDFRSVKRVTNAQVLYDFRTKSEFCSGSDLHSFFLAQLDEPSPSGEVQVRVDTAREFVSERLDHMAAHNESMTDWCEKQKAVFERLSR